MSITKGNGVECIECGNIDFDEKLVVTPDDYPNCPKCESDVVQPVLVREDIPLGVDPDEASDYWHYGISRYVFNLDM